MNLRRIRYLGTVILKGHLGNALWRPHLERRRCRSAVTRKALLQYLQPYGPLVRTVPADPPVEDGPRRIFSLWLQGEAEAPPLVKACFASIRTHCPEELVVLDADSLWDWIQLPDYVVEKWKSGRMRAAHFADICRIELLYRYGGVWMDATDYVDQPFPNWLWAQDFFVYLSGNTQRGSHSFIQNCFIRGARGNYLLKVWREAVLSYWKEENTAIDYFVHQVLFLLCVENNPQAAALFAAMPRHDQDPTHVLWFQHVDDPYDPARWKEICAPALFQKTDYKSLRARQPLPGSVAAHLLSLSRQP